MTPEEIKAKRREYNKKWREAHPGYNREYMRKYVANNREAWNEYCMNFQRKHKEAQNERMLKYHQTKEGHATNLLHSYKQADREKGIEVTNLTREDIMNKSLSENSECVYCGSKEKLGLDRIGRYWGHETFNTVCSCRKCNVKRSRKSFDEWLISLGYQSLEQWLEDIGGTESEHMVIKYPEKVSE